MLRKPTYEELEQRVKELQREASEPKRADEGPRESHDVCRELADLLPQTVFEIDERGNFTFANRYGLESSGYTQGDIDKGLNALQLFIPEDRQRVAENMRKILRGEKSQGHEYTALRKDGSTFPVLVYSSAIIRGDKPVGLRGIVIDMTEHKKMEEAVARARSYLENTLASAPDGVLLLDEQERFTYVNPIFLRWLGREAEDFHGKTVQEVSPPLMSPATTRTIVRRARRRLKSGEPIVGAEVEIIDKHGKPMPVAYSAAGIRDEKGTITGEVVCIRDMTEHKKMEKNLKIKEAAIASALSGIAINDLEERFIYVNDFFVKMVGCESDRELLGKTPLDITLDGDKALEAMQAVRNEGSWSGEFGTRRKDGSVFYAAVTAHLVKDESGSPLCTLASIIDISNQKRMERELRDSEERYRRLFEDADEAIFLADLKTSIILAANRQAERLIGCPRGELIGMPQSRLHPPDHAEYYEEKFRKFVRKGRVLDLQAEVIRRDGAILPVFISTSVVTIQGRQVMQGIFRDATQERTVLNLAEEIATRQAVDKAKRVLMDRHGITDKEAMRRLQKESRRQRRKVKDTAQAVISSELILNR
jgi:PAS domain S-box-containing protein